MKLINYIAILLVLQCIVCKFSSKNGHQNQNRNRNKHGSKTRNRNRHTHRKSHAGHKLMKYVKSSVRSVSTIQSTTNAEDLKESALFLVSPSMGGDLTISDVSTFKATPEAVEKELTDKST